MSGVQSPSHLPSHPPYADERTGTWEVKGLWPKATHLVSREADAALYLPSRTCSRVQKNNDVIISYKGGS